MRVVLAEKPSVARDLASFLGAEARRDGYFEGQGYQVTWALGHLVTLREPEDYDPALKRWCLEALPIVPERFGLKLIDDRGARKQFGVIKRLFRGADELIGATDAGREGELIFRYILELTGCAGKPIRRLWLNSLTEAAIREAFRRLRPASAYDALYESKLISYPRTDSRYLSSDMKPEVPGILRDLRPIKPHEIGKLDLDSLVFTGQIVNDRKVSDHHAIIPTGKHAGPLSPGAEKIYDAIVTRLIAMFYPDCVKDITLVDGQSNEVPFRARGVRVIEPGWTALYPRRSDDRNEDEQELPEFRPGERGPHEPLLRAGETTPPKHYTENTLLGAMETAGKLVDDEQLKDALKAKGLGTPATRAAIIETLLQRGYIARDKKTLTATDLGRYLVAIVHDRLLKSAELTGEWEAKLREIEHGRLDPRRFMREIVQYTGDLIRSGDTSTVDESKLGDCPRCGRPVIEGKRGYGCSGWREGCPFVLWKTHRDQALSVGHIRELLQRRVLLEPTALGGAGGVILHLTDSGAVVEIPVPSRRPRGEPVPKRRRRTVSGRQVSIARPPAPAAVGVSVSFGPCPRCGSEVVEQPKSYRCSGSQQGCPFVIWKTIAGKRIGARTAQALLREGRSEVLKGFRSKAGKPFEARLKVDQGDVHLDFGQA